LGRRIDASTPYAAAEGIKILRMFANQERFSHSITVLLFYIIPDPRSPVMPDKSRRTESNVVTCLLQSPADIDVVTRGAKNRIKTANFHQGPLVEGHVATGDMLGLAITEHHVSGTSRRYHHCRGHE